MDSASRSRVPRNGELIDNRIDSLESEYLFVLDDRTNERSNIFSRRFEFVEFVASLRRL